MKKSKAIQEALQKISTTKYKFNLYKDVIVRTLDADLTEVTELFAFWAVEHERMQAKYLQKELQLKRLHASLDGIVRKKISKGTIEKLTEGGILNKIKLNTTYQSLEDEMYKLRGLAGELNVARMSLSMKKDVLQSIAANRRKEIDEKGLAIKSKKEV